ncbi:hypothetical protein Hanom_Chr06g00545381 [Helianthus anomalus]
MINNDYLLFMHPYSLIIPRTHLKNFILSLSLLHILGRAPLYPTTISFSNSKYEESRALHGDFKLVRRFGGDFK